MSTAVSIAYHVSDGWLVKVFVDGDARSSFFFDNEEDARRQYDLLSKKFLSKHDGPTQVLDCNGCGGKLRRDQLTRQEA